MMVRRQLLNFGSRSTDFRIGSGALDELTRLAKGAVAKPRRAVIVCDEALAETTGVTVSRALVDAGFRVSDLSMPRGEHISTLAYANQLFDALDRCGITCDDLVVALGGTEVCSLVTFCASSWCGETACALIPTTLDAMVTCATEMRALDTAESPEMVRVRPQAALVVCDLSLVLGRPLDENGLGLVQIVAAQLCESRKFWDRMATFTEGIVAGREIPLSDAICAAQTSRVNTVKSIAPSARQALGFGVTTARALRVCLGPDVPWYRLLAEGMRFEARLAVDAADFKVDDVFALDDRFEELGIDELPFSLEVERFIAALKETRFKRANRFMFSLPKHPGAVRLSVVEDDLLKRHAEAYLAARAELLDEDGTRGQSPCPTAD